jgi:hypothetical protein
MTPQRIQCRRTKGWKMPPDTVYVGRPTRWGNPFPVDHEGTAIECIPLGLDGGERIDRAKAAIDLYRRWLTGGKVNELIALFLAVPDRAPPTLQAIQRDLGGKNLACWCAVGLPCHADVLLELANPTRSMAAGVEDAIKTFLSRFVSRGWLHGTRDDPAEQTAVDHGLQQGWLRRELGEVHFTPEGRKALGLSE